MANEKCCYDCVFCIPAPLPIECGMHYDCIHKDVGMESIDPWGEACLCFIGEDGSDGK